MAAGGAQIVQQIEGLLAQLAQAEPEPVIQRMIQEIQKPIEQLQQVVGKDDMQDMHGGGMEGVGGMGGGMGGAAAGGMPSPTGEGGGELPSGAGGASEGGEPGGLVIHIKPGGSKSFGGANKAAMANFRQKGHFGSGSEAPETERTRNKAKARAQS